MLKARFRDDIYITEIDKISSEALKSLAEKAGQLLALQLVEKTAPEDVRIEVNFTFFTE